MQLSSEEETVHEGSCDRQPFFQKFVCFSHKPKVIFDERCNRLLGVCL